MSEEFTINKENGNRISVKYTPSRMSNDNSKPLDKLVVLSPAFCGHNNQYPIYSKLADVASNSGFDVARVDFAGLGKSSGEHQYTTMTSQISDLTAVVDQFSKDRPVYLVGHGLGGIISTNVAVKDLRVRGVVLWNSPPNMKLAHEEYKKDFTSDNKHTEQTIGVAKIKIGKAMWEEFASIEHASHTFSRIPVMAIYGSEDYARFEPLADRFFSQDLMNQLTIIKDADPDFKKPNMAEATIKLTVDWLKR